MTDAASNQEFPHLYLFCDHTFGLPFSKTLLRLFTKKAKVVIVNSERYRKNKYCSFAAYEWTRFGFYLIKRYLALYAQMQNTVVLTVRDVNDPEFLKGIPAGSHGVVAGFNQIFKREAIASLQSLVNFHSSVLPLYRGPIPSYWVLRNREERTGYTIHRVTERIDGGEVLFQEAISCDGAKSAEDLDRRIARSAQSTFVRYLDHILYGQEWNPVKLDAFSIYRTRLDYGRRPTEYSFFNKNLESTGTSRETRA